MRAAVKRKARELRHRRNHIRIRLHEGVYADVSVISVQGSAVETRAIPVIVKDISPVGIRFLTHLRFPVSGDYTIKVALRMGEWELGLAGQIVWRGREENQYSYGCLLHSDRDMRHALGRAILWKLGEANPRMRRILELYRTLNEQQERIGGYMDLRS